MAPILPLAATLPIRCTEGGGGPLGEGGGASEIRRLRRPPPHVVLEEEKGRGEVPLERGGQLVKITDKTKYIQSSAARVAVGCRYTRPTWRSPPHQPTCLRGFPAGRHHNSWSQAMAEPSPAA